MPIDLSSIAQLVILIGIIVFISILFISMFSPAPFLPTNYKKVDLMIKEAHLMQTDTVFDLGSGDGRIVITAAEMGVKEAVGFEINPALNLFAKAWAKVMRLKNTNFITKSFWRADLAECNKLFLYLLPKTLDKLETKIIEEMHSGSRIISYKFKFKNLKLVKSLEKDEIYVYEV
jgi:predicted RNA methylase